MPIYDHRILNNGDFLQVSAGDQSIDTTINSGGREDVINGGVSSSSIIHQGGLEFVASDGVAAHTLLFGGTLDISSEGIAEGMFFGSANSRVEVFDPHNLNPLDSTGRPQYVIAGFQVGDIIDFVKASNASLQVTPLVSNGNFKQQTDLVTISYTEFSQPSRMTYEFYGTQPNTQYALQPDGHGGTELILTHTHATPHDTSLIGIADSHVHGPV